MVVPFPEIEKLKGETFRSNSEFSLDMVIGRCLSSRKEELSSRCW